MSSADPDATSDRAKERGRSQIGTLGAGNHFIEVGEVTDVFDEDASQRLGLELGAACLWIHCGSRGLGHQVCTDAVRTMQSAVAKYHIALPDRELACAPFDSDEAQEYFRAMSCAANYAWANRQVITHHVRRAFDRALRGRFQHRELRVVYDVCHNIAKVEEHSVAGTALKLCVHRKGATRAFGPGRPEVPADYRRLGQPVLIPGSMGTASYILVGTDKAMTESFGSACHGAGRVMSRTKARKQIRGDRLRSDLAREGIAVRARSMRVLAEEAPNAYKDVNRVVDVVHDAGLAHRVARTRPLGVIKG